MLNLLATMVINPLHRPSSHGMLWSIKIICNHKYFNISLFLGHGGVPPHQRHPQVPSFTQTGIPKYDFFNLFFDHNFPGNDNQTFNVYAESTLSTYRKGHCMLGQDRTAQHDQTQCPKPANKTIVKRDKQPQDEPNVHAVMVPMSQPVGGWHVTSMTKHPKEQNVPRPCPRILGPTQ